MLLQLFPILVLWFTAILFRCLTAWQVNERCCFLGREFPYRKGEVEGLSNRTGHCKHSSSKFSPFLAPLSIAVRLGYIPKLALKVYPLIWPLTRFWDKTPMSNNKIHWLICPIRASQFTLAQMSFLLKNALLNTAPAAGAACCLPLPYPEAAAPAPTFPFRGTSLLCAKNLVPPCVLY